MLALRHSHAMPMYRFTVEDGSPAPEADACELRDLDQAKETAVAMFCDSLRDRHLRAFDPSHDFSLHVANADGLTLFDLMLIVQVSPVLRGST